MTCSARLSIKKFYNLGAIENHNEKPSQTEIAVCKMKNTLIAQNPAMQKRRKKRESLTRSGEKRNVLGAVANNTKPVLNTVSKR